MQNKLIISVLGLALVATPICAMKSNPNSPELNRKALKALRKINQQARLPLAEQANLIKLGNKNTYLKKVLAKKKDTEKENRK